MTPYTHILAGETLTNEQIHSMGRFVDFHFGVLRRGVVVYKSQWISTYQSVYAIDSTHATEQQAQWRVEEIITRGMINMSKAEREQVAALRLLDKWSESEGNL